MIKNSYKSNQKIYEAEVIESSTIDSNIILKILIKAGRSIAKPALEVLEMAIDPLTPTNCSYIFNSCLGISNNAFRFVPRLYASSWL